ncbi:MAG: sporulation integral membrane protein YtvI [Clostridia bacterium]|nr:sporulation integral membrane protein YtvI [Clostridia bacterium]
MRTVYAKYSEVIHQILILLVILALMFIAITFLLPFFTPFVIAIVIASINEPLIRILEKFKIPRKLSSIIVLLITMSILGFLITIGVIKIYNELVFLQNNVTTHVDTISSHVNSYVDQATSYYNSLPKEISNTISQNLKGLAPKLEGIVTSVAKYLINTITSIPKMTVFFIVTLLSTYFISSDRKIIKKFFYRQLPVRWATRFSGIKSDTFTALLGYFKALLILMAFTFVEVTIGLMLIGADYAILMGLVVAISDAIPIVGTGVIMIPWILWNLITGNVQMALGLTIIYLVGVIIRQIFEPKIVGSQLGLHPLVTLIAMYIGIELFGFFGVFTGPIAIIILRSFQHAGVIKLWRE